MTLSLDVESYRRAKVTAAAHGVSVSSLVRDYFDSLETPSVAPPTPPRPVNLLEALGDERVADIDLEIPRFDAVLQAADLS